MLLVLLVNVIILVGYFSYAMFTVEKVKNQAISIAVGTMAPTLVSDKISFEVNGLENIGNITLQPRSVVIMEVTMSNQLEIDGKFQMYYKGDLPSGISIYYTQESAEGIAPEGVALAVGESKIYELMIINNNSAKQTITIGGTGGLSWNPLILDADMHTIDKLNVTEYQIITNNVTEGSISVGNSGVVGEEISFTPTPSTGYSYDGATITNELETTIATLDASTNSFIMPASTVTITPKWKANMYTVKYSCGSGSGTAPTTQTATYDETFSVATNTCSKTGYTFTGWTDPTGSSWTNWTGTWKYVNGQYGISNNSLTLTAQWTPTSYAISKRSVTGGSVSASSTGTYGSTISFTTSPSSGFSYAGATIRNSSGTVLQTLDSSTKSFTMPAQAVTISPKWKKNDYMVIALNTGSNATWVSRSDGAGGYFGQDTSSYFLRFSMPTTQLSRMQAWTTTTFDLTHYQTYRIKVNELWETGYEHPGHTIMYGAVSTSNSGWVHNGTGFTQAAGQGNRVRFDIDIPISSLSGNYFLGWGAYNNNQYGSCDLTHATLIGKVYE